MSAIHDSFYLKGEFGDESQEIMNMKARELKMSKGYEFVWHRNGNIFLKKTAQDKQIQIVTRAEWGARPPLSKKKTPPIFPLEHIRFGYTNTEKCYSRYECITLLQSYQRECMENGYDDIPFNFLVGCDGQMYEGRGWENDAERPKEFKKFSRKCVDIAYIGDFFYELPDEDVAQVAGEFVRRLIDAKKFTSELPHIMTLHDFREFGMDTESDDIMV